MGRLGSRSFSMCVPGTLILPTGFFREHMVGVFYWDGNGGGSRREAHLSVFIGPTVVYLDRDPSVPSIDVPGTLTGHIPPKAFSGRRGGSAQRYYRRKRSRRESHLCLHIYWHDDGILASRSVRFISIYVPRTLADHIPPKGVFWEDEEGAFF
jgi:hypothetical protein